MPFLSAQKKLELGVIQLLTCCFPQYAEGFPQYQSEIPNGDKVPGHPALGHLPPNMEFGGGPRNAFGEAFAAAGRTWTTELCEGDADDDGQTNGLELGDPGCVFKKGDIPSRVEKISSPIDSASQTTALVDDTLSPEDKEALKNATRVLDPLVLHDEFQLPLREYPYNFGERPFDIMEFEWSSSAEDKTVTGTFRFRGHWWVAVGPKSADKMDGLLIQCRMNSEDPEDADGSCEDWYGDGWDYLSAGSLSRPTAVTDFRSGRNGSMNTISFTRPLTFSENSTEEQFHFTGEDVGRTIWAYGPIDVDASIPFQRHHGSAVGTSYVNFKTGAALQKKHPSTMVWPVVGMGLLLLIAGIAHLVVDDWAYIKVHHWARKVWSVAIALLMLALLGLFLWRAHADYQVKLYNGPVVRAMGAGAALLQGGLLLSAGRRFFMQDFLGVSHERAMIYHSVMGTLFLVFFTWHMIGMIHMYGGGDGTPYWLSWGSQPTDNRVWPLAGFIGAIFGFLTALPALSRFHISYRLFRFMHFLWILVVIFNILHVRLALWFSIPGLVNVVFSFIYGTIVNWSAKVESVHHDPRSQTMAIRVVRKYSEWVATGKSRAIGIAPGQWCYLWLTDIAPTPHPFSVARSEVRTNGNGNLEQHLLFIVKASNGKENGRVIFRKCISDATKTKNSMSSRLAGTNPLPLQVPPSFGLGGPFGKLTLPLESYRNFILASGGIGVTPNMLIMQTLADMARSSGKRMPVQNVFWVWVNRDTNLMIQFESLLLRDIATLREAGVNVVVKNFVTGSVTIPSDLDIVSGRPQWQQEYDEFAKGCSNGSTVGVYNCGPGPLIASSTDAANKSKLSFHVHSEVFEI